MENRTFTKQEIEQIIKRAAELESEQLSKSNREMEGLSLDELVTVASDSGLDPEHVRMAVHELEKGAITESGSAEGRTPDSVSAERWVNGRLSDELADAVVADLKHRYDASEAETSWHSEWHDDEWEEHRGKSSVQKTGRSVEWKHIDKTGSLETRVLLQPRGKKIRVRVTKRNLWGSSDDGPGSEIYEYIGAIPIVTGFVLLFSLPYGFLVNLLIGLLAFITLEFIATPVIKKMKEKWGNSLTYRKKARIEDDREHYRIEVEKTADEIGIILKTGLDESMLDDASLIELNHMENLLRDPEGGEGSGVSKRKRVE
jgi:hypothetical protein